MPPEDKQVLWEATPSHWIKAHVYVGFMVAAAIFFYGGYALPNQLIETGLAEHLGPVMPYVRWTLFAFGLACLFVIFWVGLNLRYTRYVLTEDTLYTRTNWLSGNHDTIWVHLIRDVRAELPLHLRIIGLGHVMVESLDRSNPQLRLIGVRKARDIKERLNQMAPERAAQYGVRGLDTGGA